MQAGKRLALFRRDRGLSRLQLAQLLKLERSFVGLLERGKRHAGIVTAQRIRELTADWERGPIEILDWVGRSHSSTMKDRAAVGEASR